MIAREWIQPRVTSGGLELVKWVALVCMVVDHVNLAFFARELPLWATVTGRVAFPLFALVFAFNLSRPGIDRTRMLNRLMLAAGIAQPFHGLLFGSAFGLWPLNILFLFVVVLGAVVALERGSHGLALACMGAGGLLVEYGFVGVLLPVAAWAHFRKPSPATAAGVLVAMLGLCWLNGNAYALLALPLFAVGSVLDLTLPRARWAFYAFYPAHLALIVALR